MKKWDMWVWISLVTLAIIINQTEIFKSSLIVKGVVSLIYILAGLRLLSYCISNNWWD